MTKLTYNELFASTTQADRETLVALAFTVIATGFIVWVLM